ncbi:MAG: hypothetical protein LBE99_00800 [Puniceicoccales bacterium]|jgi:hypothetical protein|nr:hypothetical protein [Puniceicoccales bacterium]
MIPWLKNLESGLHKENFGLLLLRFFWGSHLIVYSICCFMDGGMLKHLGHPAIQLHFPFSELFWGIVAAFTFIWTGLFIILGFYFRLATLILFTIGLIGMWEKLSWKLFFLPPLSPLVFLTILGLVFSFIGAGKFSIK